MAEVNIPDLPGNSYSKKAENQSTDKPEVKQVTTGNVIHKKESDGKRFLGMFKSKTDRGTIVDYILFDVLAPAAKNAIADAVKGGIDMALFGEKRGERTYRDRGTSRVGYTNYRAVSSDPVTRRSQDRGTRLRTWNDDIILQSRGEAEMVLDNMCAILEKYDCVSVANLYGLVGIETEYTDNNYGWRNLSKATVERVQAGYRLVLPPALYIGDND